MPDAPSDQKNDTLPPWLWFWLVLYAISLPAQIELWKENLNDLFFSQELPFEITGTHLAFLNRLANIPELLPSLAIFFGTLTIFLPWARTTYLERKFRLTDFVPRSQSMKDIQEFLQLHAPDIHIRANLLRTDQLAFIYPLGYRKNAIALFGGLIKLWNSDRSAAEAVLLHEVAHHRHGDALIMGTGSFFETVVDHWLAVSFILFLIPFSLVTLDQAITFFYESLQTEVTFLQTMREAGISISELSINFLSWASSFLFYQLRLLLLVILPGMMLNLISLLFWTINAFIVPIIAIWCAELSADRFMVVQKGSHRDSITVLDKLSGRASLIRWLLSQISHPPKKLRLLVGLHYNGIEGLVFSILLFPLAYFVKLIGLLGWALSNYLISYLAGTCGMDEIMTKLTANIGTYMEAMQNVWLSIAVLILVWRFMAAYWERLFCGETGTQNQTDNKI